MLHRNPKPLAISSPGVVRYVMVLIRVAIVDSPTTSQPIVLPPRKYSLVSFCLPE